MIDKTVMNEKGLLFESICTSIQNRKLVLSLSL